MIIDSFYVHEWDSVAMGFIHQIREEIESRGKDYVLNVKQDELVEYFYDKYNLIPLAIIADSETFGEPSKFIKKEYNQRLGHNVEREVYQFKIYYSFLGSPILFSLHPNQYSHMSYQIDVSENNNTVSFSFDLYKQDPDEFKKTKNECYRAAFTNIDNINREVEKWNNSLKPTINNIINSTKEKYIKENIFYEAINLKKSSDTKSIFSVPTVKRKIVPQPEMPHNKKYASVPTVSLEIYYDIINVINNAGRKMELKPSLFIDKDEEGLRDQFLFILEDRYEGATATGETFNKSGKADILLKYSKDSSNLFIAECKFWKGVEEFYKAINQLFDRYLTWRDSKVALIVFVTNKDFTKVLNTVKTDILKHPYYIRGNGVKGETSFSYIFHLPSDNDKEIFLEVILFNFYNENA